MSTIRLSYKHAVSNERLLELLDDFRLLLELLSQANVHWSGHDRLEIRGPNVEGRISCGEDRLDLVIRLGPALRVVTETVRATFERELQEIVRAGAVQ